MCFNISNHTQHTLAINILSGYLFRCTFN